MPILISTRGPKRGRCNICGTVGLLTEDHTPPKGCKRPNQVTLHHIAERLNVNKHAKGRFSQNGVKYRTLCARCNNHYLGSEYDPYFISFVNHIAEYLTSTLIIPPVMIIRNKPQRIMRSLLGHLCAQGVDRYDKGPITVPMRDYLIDSTCYLPLSIKIYTWVFPYRGHVMAKDCAFTDLRIGEPVYIWFLKFYPVAFLVTFNEPKEYKFDFVELSAWRNEHIDFETDINVILRPIVNEYWPEAPTKTTIIIYGQEAITSFNTNKLIG